MPKTRTTKQYKRTTLQHRHAYGNQDRARDEMLMDGAAQKAVREVFFKLGVDVNNPHDLEDFRQDMRFSRTARQLAGHGILALVGVVAAAMAAAVWTGVVSAIRGGGQ